MCPNASTREHLIPRKRGKRKGGLGPPLVVACAWCNSSRGDRTDAEWIELLERVTYEGIQERKRQDVLRRFEEYPGLGTPIRIERS